MSNKTPQETKVLSVVTRFVNSLQYTIIIQYPLIIEKFRIWIQLYVSTLCEFLVPLERVIEWYIFLFSSSTNRDDQIKRKISRKENQAFQGQSSSYPYAALPSYYPHPPVAPPPHPPLMYPVPMIPVHPGYAPWIVPQQGFNGVNSGLFNAHHAER